MKESNNGNGGVRKLPLWKGCLEELIAGGVHYGASYDASWFEDQLACKRNSREFGLSVHKIRMALEERGLYLEGHAQRAGKLVILEADKNVGVMRGKRRRVAKELRRAVTLGSATDVSQLSKRVRAAHEKELARMVIRQMLLIRAARVAKVLQKRAPKLLEPRSEV